MPTNQSPSEPGLSSQQMRLKKKKKKKLTILSVLDEGSQ
jgi:hypothetical protein